MLSLFLLHLIVFPATSTWTKPETLWTMSNKTTAWNDVILRIGYLTGSERRRGDQEYSRPGQSISGGLTLALSDLRDSGFWGEWSDRVKVELSVGETFGSDEVSVEQVATMWKYNMSVIIGPQETCFHEAKLAASLNIPLISYFCSDERTSDKTEFPTFGRTRPPDAAISRAVVSLLLKFGWFDWVTVIYSECADDERFKRVANSLTLLLTRHNVTFRPQIPYKGPYHHGYADNPFHSIVAQTYLNTRIYILISEYFEHLGLVLALKKHNLIDSGDYVVIGVSMDDYNLDESQWEPFRYFRGLLRDESEKEAPEAFRGYLGVVASPPRNFTEFSHRVNHFMEKEPFNFPNPLAKLGGYKKIRMEAAYLYDAVFVYAAAIRSLLLQYGDARGQMSAELEQKLQDGKELGMRLRNLSYYSAAGHESRMDEFADAEGNFTLVSLKPVISGMKDNFGLLPELKLTDSIDWISGFPPVSEPKCGFQGEKCKRDSIHSIWWVGLGVVLVLLLGGGAGVWLAFRHSLLSRHMDSLLWRIEKREIQWQSRETNNENNGNNNGSNSNGNKEPVGQGQGGSSSSSFPLSLNGYHFAPLVIYRQRSFAGKVINVQQLDEPIKQQLKMLREIRHENLNGIVGACVGGDDTPGSDSNQVSLLLMMEYCSRGSLKDILDNPHFKLDRMFISSLVADLIKGLSYLHESSGFRFHGNLKGSNCLIDSRWTLKLTDFGLKRHEIRFTPHKRPSSHLIRGLMDNNHHHHLVTVTTASAHGVTTTTTKPCVQRTASNQMSHCHSFFKQSSLHCANEVTVTSPYLPPEYPLVIQETDSDKTVVDAHRKGDVYSLGVILWELLTRQTLVKCIGSTNEDKEEKEVRAAVIHGHWFAQGMTMVTTTSSNCCFRTKEGGLSCFWDKALETLSTCEWDWNSTEMSGENDSKQRVELLHSTQMVACLRDCLSLDPKERPDLKALRTSLRILIKEMHTNIFDTMLGLMEKYAGNLEILVDERTKQLQEEKRKTESLLYEMLPACVAEELKEGLKVPAQNYDCVSIYFSDIVAFTSMSAQSTPLQVVEFLNDLYTCFDSVIENYEVYKVETIGDAYMVASGLPVAKPNDSSHAVEMGRMALHILQAVSDFHIRHRPEERLAVRIGIHSGPVCAGVVGLKRPRYCLFGDTVNTASRMESTGQPLRIHCSSTFAGLLETSETFAFHLMKRGCVDVKGKGIISTFWLLGCQPRSNDTECEQLNPTVSTL